MRSLTAPNAVHSSSRGALVRLFCDENNNNGNGWINDQTVTVLAKNKEFDRLDVYLQKEFGITDELERIKATSKAIAAHEASVYPLQIRTIYACFISSHFANRRNNTNIYR